MTSSNMKYTLIKLLKSEIDKIDSIEKKRERLFKCIDNSKVQLKSFNNYTETNINSDINLCKLCNSNDFISDKYEEICKKCGTTRTKQSNLKIYEEVSYIKPNQNNIKIIRDGKIVNVDLNKINLWLQEKDPLYESTNNIIEALNNLY